MAETKPPEKIAPPKKGQEKIVKEDPDDMPAYQEMVLFYLTTGIKTVLIAWCITIISLAYIKLPESKWWVADQRIDATYAAGVLGGLLGSLGVTVANAGKKKEEKNNASAKREIDELKKALTELSNAQQYQTIRVITPLRIEGAEVVKTDPITGKEIDPQSGKLK
jgi:hypothetical protein